MVRRRCCIASLVLALITLAGCGPGGSSYFNSYQGKAPPELGNGSWINSDGLTLAELKGKVVWLEFSFLH